MGTYHYMSSMPMSSSNLATLTPSNLWTPFIISCTCWCPYGHSLLHVINAHVQFWLGNINTFQLVDTIFPHVGALTGMYHYMSSMPMSSSSLAMLMPSNLQMPFNISFPISVPLWAHTVTCRQCPCPVTLMPSNFLMPFIISCTYRHITLHVIDSHVNFQLANINA